MSTPAAHPSRPRLPASLPVAGELATDDESSWATFEIRADLSNRSLSRLDIVECRLTGAQFTLATLDQCRVRDSLFADCEVSGAAFEAVALTRVEFVGCRLTGAILSRGQLRDVRFSECQMRDLGLRLADGARVRFESCDLTDADFYGSTLPRARFVDCDLTHADFSGADLRGARLHGSTLDRLRGVASLTGAIISSAQLIPLAAQLLGVVGVEIDDEGDM